MASIVVIADVGCVICDPKVGPWLSRICSLECARAAESIVRLGTTREDEFRLNHQIREARVIAVYRRGLAR